MADEPEIEDGESEGGKSKGLLFAIIGLIVLVIGVVAALAFSGMLGGEEDVGAAEGVYDPSMDAPAAGSEVYELGDFKVNLSGSQTRILMMELAVEGLPDAMGSIEQKQHQIRDAVLMLASDYTTVELEGLEGKLRLRDEIHRRINAVLAPQKVDRVYYMKFEIAN